MLTLTEPTLGTEELVAATRAIDSKYLSPGPEVAAFEAEWAAKLDLYAPSVVACASGTLALILALHALRQGIRERARPIAAIPSFTCAPVAAAVVNAGWQPLFVAASPFSLSMDPKGLKLACEASAIDVVIPVHTYGNPVDRQVFEVAREFGVRVLEDACEAHGATYHDGKIVGTLGDMAAWSFRGDKMLTTGGTGGVVWARDTIVAAEMRLARDLYLGKSTQRYEISDRAGWGCQMGEVQAAIGRAQLPRLAEVIAHRREVAAMYDDALPRNVKIGRAMGSVVWRYLIGVDDPVRLMILLADQGIETVRAFRPLHHQGVGSSAVFRDPMGDSSVDAMLHATGLCLPIGPHITQLEVDRIVTAVQGGLT